jgi:hypothetical protein
MVRKAAAVGLTEVTLAVMPVAVVGMVQLPLAPHTVKVWVSCAPSGVARMQTFTPGSGLVSASRQGAMGTNDDTVPSLAPT